MLTSLDSGDTAWILICALLGFCIIFGLTFFYGGLRGKK